MISLDINSALCYSPTASLLVHDGLSSLEVVPEGAGLQPRALVVAVKITWYLHRDVRLRRHSSVDLSSSLRHEAGCYSGRGLGGGDNVPEASEALIRRRSRRLVTTRAVVRFVRTNNDAPSSTLVL